MSVVNHQFGYIFFHEPYTAGRAVEDALMHHFGSHNCNGNHHILRDEMLRRKFVTVKEFDSYLKFRVLRNPYDVLLTTWIRNNRGRTSFSEWARTDGLSFIKDQTLFWRYREHTDLNIRYEQLQKRLNEVLHRVNAQPVDLRLIGVTIDKPDWRSLLTVAEARQLEELYPDFQTYGYNLFRY